MSERKYASVHQDLCRMGGEDEEEVEKKNKTTRDKKVAKSSGRCPQIWQRN